MTEARPPAGGGTGAPCWGYSNGVGPDRWGALCEDWRLCGEGVEQSPVDIPATVAAGPLPLVVDYRPCPLELVNTGHSVQVNCRPGSRLDLAGVSYELRQFHFHARSEHLVGGRAYAMELVHEGAGGAMAVIGVFIEVGDESAALAAVFEHLPTTAGDPVRVDGVAIDASTLLPARRTGWSYRGSLTTPPCTEGVSWVVMDTPLTASAAQISQFTRLYADNYRPVQPHNGRLTIGEP